MTHEDEKFNEYLQRLVRDIDPVPEVPREELWARIDATRRPLRAAAAAQTEMPARPDERHASDVIPLAQRRPARLQLLRWSAALAAMLVLGVGIGRMTLLRQGGGSNAPLAGDSAARADSVAILPYRLAAVQHLQKTEALLTALPTDARTGHVTEVAGWAGDLLTDTRLLLDSPAGADPELKQLLEDLELVLAQIAVLRPRDAMGEMELIEDGMNQRDVLLRLRAATARPDLAGS